MNAVLRRAPAWETPGFAAPAEAGAALLETWMRDEGQGRWVTTSRLELLWTNGTADWLAETSRVLTHVGGRLTLTDPAAQARLFEVASADGDDHHVLTLAEEGRWLVIMAQRLATTGGVTGLGLRCQWSDAVGAGRWADLGQVFGLTVAEATVARRLVEGLNVDEIAQERGSSVETIRTHVRRLYCKTGVTGRERLFSLLSGFRA